MRSLSCHSRNPLTAYNSLSQFRVDRLFIGTVPLCVSVNWKSCHSFCCGRYISLSWLFFPFNKFPLALSLRYSNCAIDRYEFERVNRNQEASSCDHLSVRQFNDRKFMKLIRVVFVSNIFFIVAKKCDECERSCVCVWCAFYCYDPCDCPRPWNSKQIIESPFLFINRDTKNRTPSEHKKARNSRV